MAKKIATYFNFLLITAVLLSLAAGLKADTIDELQDKIDIANKNRRALEAEIAKYQDQLKVIGNEATTLKNTISSLDVSANKITSEVKLVENNITETTYTINDTSEKISDREKQINLGRQAITKTIKQLNEADENSLWEILLTNNDLSGFWADMESTIQIQDKINTQVDTVKDIKANLEKAKAALEAQKKELEDYTAELADRKNVLLTTKKEKTVLLTATKNTEANYQKILQDKLALKEALDQEINQFESQLRLAIDPKSFPPAGKGILKWPVTPVYITQYFGKTADAKRLYVSGTHNGVDFRAAIGTKITSAGEGTVEATGDTDQVCPGASYGKWVFIRHNDGLATLYGHLSVISVKANQKIKTGATVGYSGNTGYSTGPHLHFSVYAGQGVKVSTLKSTVCKGTYTIPLADPKAYLDPMIYL